MIDCLFASPPSPPPRSASASLFHRFLHTPPLNHPSYSSSPKACKAVRLKCQFPPCVSAQLSTVGQGGRIVGGMGLAARTTAVVTSSAGTRCWSPWCEVSPKRVSRRACLVCGAGKSPLRRNHSTRILISGSDSICSGLLAARP